MSNAIAEAMLNYIQTIEKTFGSLHQSFDYDTEFPMRDSGGFMIGSDHETD